MIIEISKKIVLKAERMKKLAKIDKLNFDADYVAYDWKCTASNSDENLYDLQLFSLSITKNLLEQKFFTNEIGPVSNEIIENMDLKETIENVKKLMFDIQKKKKYAPVMAEFPKLYVHNRNEK